MDKDPIIDGRVFVRHPQLSREDVVHAWRRRYYTGLRAESENFPEFLWIGEDAKGREIEMVGTIAKGGYLIYHANTPLSRRTIIEVKLAERRRRR